MIARVKHIRHFEVGFRTHLAHTKLKSLRYIRTTSKADGNLRWRNAAAHMLCT